LGIDHFCFLHGKNFRTFCLGVRGSVRLTIEKALPFCATQQRFGPINIIEPELGAMIVFEIGFGQIPVQMSV
jgi:hypothetical protein